MAGNTESQKRVLVATSNKIGAVIPVVRELRKNGAEVRCITYGKASKFFNLLENETGETRATESAAKLPKSARLLSLYADHSYDAVRKMLDSFKPNVLLTGTNVQDSDHCLTLEQLAWDMARRIGGVGRIFSVAVVEERGTEHHAFSHLSDSPFLTAKGIIKPLSLLPDYICIGDEAQLKMMSSPYPLMVPTDPFITYHVKVWRNLPPTDGGASISYKHVNVSFEESKLRLTGNPAESDDAARKVADFVLSLSSGVNGHAANGTAK